MKQKNLLSGRTWGNQKTKGEILQLKDDKSSTCQHLLDVANAVPRVQFIAMNTF